MNAMASQQTLVNLPFVDSSPLVCDGAALRRRAAREGYLFFRGLIGAGIIQDLRRTVLQLCREHGWLADGSDLMEGVAREGVRLGAHDDPRWIAFLGQALILPDIRKLRLHPHILDVLEKLYGGPVMPDEGEVCRVVSPSTSEFTTLPHQDHYYLGGSEQSWTVWIPLGDCPRELGGLAILSRSHSLGLTQHAGDGARKQCVTIPESGVWVMDDLTCGDVVMFNCLTIHRATHNLTSDRLRLSMDYRYQPAG